MMDPQRELRLTHRRRVKNSQNSLRERRARRGERDAAKRPRRSARTVPYALGFALKVSDDGGRIERGVAARPLENGAEVDAVDDFPLVKGRAASDPDCSPERYRPFDQPAPIGQFGHRPASRVGIGTHDDFRAACQRDDQRRSKPQRDDDACE